MKPDLTLVHTNQRLVLQELLKRGVSVEILVPELEIVEARFGTHIELLLDRDSSRTPYAGSLIASNKYLTKKLLFRAGLPTPCGEQFFADQRDDALRFALSLGGPVVIKPSLGSHGDGCFTDRETPSEIGEAIDRFVSIFGAQEPFLIERQMPGMEIRIFISRSGDYAALHRDPASVIGDGIHTIHQLADAESHRRMNPRTTALCPITIDDAVTYHLTRAGLSLASIPDAGQLIYLRRNSNVAKGGMCHDITAALHPDLVSLARQALLAVPGLPFAGVDILTCNHRLPIRESHPVVLEINSNPGVHMHERPGTGASQPVAAYVADAIFPETAAPSTSSRAAA